MLRNVPTMSHLTLRIPYKVIYGGIAIFTVTYSLSPGFWQSFVTIGVHKDHIPALARFCKKQLTGFFVHLLFFVKCKHYHQILNDVIKMKRNFRLLMEIILLLAGINARLEKRRVPLGRPEHHGKQC